MFACCHQATFPPAPIKSKRLFMVILIKTVSSSKVDLRKEREKKQRFRWRNIPQSDRQKRGHFPTPVPFLLFFLFSPLPFFPPQPGDLQPPISPAVKVVPAPPLPLSFLVLSYARLLSSPLSSFLLLLLLLPPSPWWVWADGAGTERGGDGYGTYCQVA